MEFVEDPSSLTSMIYEVEVSLCEVSLGEILDITIDRIGSVWDQQPSLPFIQSASKVSRKSRAKVRGKFIKREFYLLFEFINKVLLSHS